MQPKSSVEQQFFSQKNELTLVSVLSQEFQQQGALSDKQRTRLSKVVRHYCEEVWDRNGPIPIQTLNREVLLAASQDFQSYLRRDRRPSVDLQQYDPRDASAGRALTNTAYDPRDSSSGGRALSNTAYGGVDMPNAGSQRAIMPPPRGNPTYEPGLALDTGTRFEQLQQERQSYGAPRPAVPEFKLSLEDDNGIPALTLFEQAKKMREAEAARVKPSSTPPKFTEGTMLPMDDNPLVRYMSGTQSKSGAVAPDGPAATYLTPTTMNDANANSTLAQPLVMAPRGPLGQDVLIKQDDIISYKETEFNLFVYSADRDWLKNTQETRYNFSVTFDPANNAQGFTFSPSSNKKFKNISRIELVKAILPTEGLTNIVQYSGAAFNTNPRLTILAYPYVIVRIAELDNNNYGTDDALNNSFGVLQYDANWYPDTTNLTDGFLGMIPKFLKCQKVYQPTPLATLNKLSIQLQLPNGSLISDTSDTLSISNIYFGGATVGIYGGNYDTPDYIILQMSTALNSWFNQWAFTQGNTIQIKGLDITQMSSYSTNTAAANDFAAWLQRDLGHTIVGIGNSTTVDDGPNDVGYANVIIIRNRFNDPATGSTALQPFGGLANNDNLRDALVATTSFTGPKLINLTHQTHLVFRIITRELDATARVRPDNL